MPEQIVAFSREDVINFAEKIGYPDNSFVIKMHNVYGGRGIGIVDAQRSKRIELLGAYCNRPFINLETALDFVDETAKKGDHMILQKHVAGFDYSTNALADHGNLLLIAGYVAPMIQEGSALYAYMKRNEMAYKITEDVIRKTCYDGNLCIDFIEREDGSVAMLEANARINSNSPLVAHAGYNLLWQRVKILIGLPFDADKIHLNDNLSMRRVYTCVYNEQS